MILDLPELYIDSENNYISFDATNYYKKIHTYYKTNCFNNINIDVDVYDNIIFIEIYNDVLDILKLTYKELSNIIKHEIIYEHPILLFNFEIIDELGTKVVVRQIVLSGNS